MNSHLMSKTRLETVVIQGVEA
eukprot:SAG31_NODE_32680_length_352_cov_32.671937_1_plen_21_part_10